MFVLEAINVKCISVFGFVFIYIRSKEAVKVFFRLLRFFGVFAKLWKATITFVMPARVPACLSVRPSVRLCVRMKWLGSYLTDLREFWYLSIFRKCIEKIQFSLQSDKNNGYYYFRHACLPACLSVRPSVFPHEMTRLLLDWFSWILISEYFSKMHRENSIFFTIWQE